MILNVANLNKSYLEKPILRDVSFHLEDKEKCALVGINGCGKSTLIRCLVGDEEPDSGVIALAKGKKMGYLAQQHDDENYGEEYASMSGGQKTRAKLEELFLTKPDLLILDEPTNHLDIEAIQWLEKFLKHYDGAVLLVSHDRYFLDRVVSKVIDLDGGKARVYKGNYSEYAEKKRMIRDAEYKAYLNQQAEIKHQEAVIERLKSFNREKSIKRAESREKQLEKIERLEKPSEINNEMKLALEPNVLSGNDVLTVKGLSKSYGEKKLFEQVDFEIKRGEHVAVIGANGTGKTTLLKILNEIEPADSGEFRLGSKVAIGYYDQEHAVLDMNKTLFEEIQDAYPTLNNTKIRNVLAAFLFTGDDVYKRIGDLSGGEQGRVSLAKLMLSDSNLLILDEPTNHLDIQGKEILEQAIRSYSGTIIYVSHDRYFINQTATRILELYNGRFDNYIGNYDYYLEKCEDVRRYGDRVSGGDKTMTIKPEVVKKEEKKNDWALQKERQSKIRKFQNDIKKCEDRITQLEAENEALDEEMAKPENANVSATLMQMHTKQEENNKELEQLYEQWETLSEAYAEFEQM